MVAKLLHPPKQYLPKDVMEEGMVTLANLSHSPKQ